MGPKESLEIRRNSWKILWNSIQIFVCMLFFSIREKGQVFSKFSSEYDQKEIKKN